MALQPSGGGGGRPSWPADTQDAVAAAVELAESEKSLSRSAPEGLLLSGYLFDISGCEVTLFMCSVVWHDISCLHLYEPTLL